jgi:hypothetical protein
MPRENLPFCDCRWLDRAARDPLCPIEFDRELNEYHLKTANGFMLIYHCPFCAGRAPDSLRPQIFATVTPEETTRLHLLTKNLKTEKQVLAHLGPPTRVFDPGAVIAEPDKDGKPGEIRACRSLRYENHSDTATINVNVGRYGKVRISFSGKYIGKPKKARTRTSKRSTS